MARERKPPGKIDRLLDELMEDGVDAEDLFGEDGLLKRMKKRMAERIWKPLTDHLGYEKHAPDGRNRGNSRFATKTLKDDKGDLPVEIPRDREGSLRSEADPQVSDPLARLRRQDHLHVRKGHEMRHPRPYRRSLRGVHLARTGLGRDHRRRDRRGPGLAVACPWTRSIRSCSWMPCSSRCVIAAAYGTRRSTWPWALTCTATRNSWSSGSSRTKGQSSGSTY